jgi:hypothetical protein
MIAWSAVPPVASTVAVWLPFLSTHTHSSRALNSLQTTREETRGDLATAAKWRGAARDVDVACRKEARVPPPDLREKIEPLSPELVLVDGKIATGARSLLPQGEDTLARIELLIRAHRIVEARRAPVGADSARPIVSPGGRRPSSHRRRALAAIVTAAAALASALLIGARIDFGGQPARADFTPIGEPPREPPVPPAATPKPAAQPRQTRKTRATRPSKSQRPSKRPQSLTPKRPQPSAPRRFVWAPAARSTAYHVELFRGATLVFRADTQRPEFVLPARWKLSGKRHRLTPGAYQWFVWPVADGRRSAAIVRAELSVPAR